jgi:hypothetical protein
VIACGAAGKLREQEDQVSDDESNIASTARKGGADRFLAPYLCPKQEIDIRRGWKSDEMNELRL